MLINRNRFLCYLVCTTSLFAVEILDPTMNASDKKKTGVHKLTNKEKALLQKWIDTHYEKKNEPLHKKPQNKHPILQETLRNGRFIRLSDQTLWEISPDGSAMAQWWITPVEIIVSQSGESEYPYLLTNKLTETSLKARKSEIHTLGLSHSR